MSVTPRELSAENDGGWNSTQSRGILPRPYCIIRIRECLAVSWFDARRSITAWRKKYN